MNVAPGRIRPWRCTQVEWIGPMSPMKKLLAAGAFAAVAALATQAQAATYLLTASDAFGSGSYGTVDVTQSGANTLKYVLTLADGFNLTDTGSHYAFSFALQNAPTLTFSGPSGYSLSTSANNIQNAPFNGFDYGVNCSSCSPSGGSSNPTSLTFTVTKPGLTTSMVDFATSTYNNNQIYFAADVIKTKNCTGSCTGVVGSFQEQATGAIPEPASWAMMILGVFVGGAVLRRRRAMAIRSVSA
jgi:hypothetical protein